MKEVVSVNPSPPPLPPQLIKAKQPGYLDLTTEQVDRLISKEPIDQDYDVEAEPFARGKYATVRRCRDKQTGKQYAAKFLRKRRRNADLRPEILHEVAVLEACTSNSRIVNLYKVFETSTEMILLLELAPGGELQMVLDRDEVPSEPEVARLMRQILDGLQYLHFINVAHLDIKPQNLVLTADFPNCDVKLCDFGISRYLSEGADVREILGTPDYVAPEVLNYEPIDVQTDMWSVGVLMYVLLTGCSPFGGNTKQETFCNISQCKLDFPEDLFQDISEDALDLMKKLMVKNPRDRLTANECLEHRWFLRAPTTTYKSPSRVTDEELNGDTSSNSSTSNSNSNRNANGTTCESSPMRPVAKPCTNLTSTDVADSTTPVKQQQHQHLQQQQQQQQMKKFSALSKSCDNSPVPAMSASRRKSFKDNMESLVRRLERELADGGGAVESTTVASSCRTLSRANGTQTMPVGGGLDIAPFTFRQVYVVDEQQHHDYLQHHQQQQQMHHLQQRPRAPSTSSTPNSSSADNSSVSDCSSDTVSEFSIDSSSDRSSIISLEDSLDQHHHHHSSASSSTSLSSSSSSSSSWCRPASSAANSLLLQQTRRLGKTSASCFDVWDSSGDGGGHRRKWPKECNGAVARAMSQFANGCGGECRPSARLRVFDDNATAKPVGGDKRRYIGLELMRERNGNVVVIREIKANSGSRYTRCSELKCESVQSRIRKLQVHRGTAVQMEKPSSNIF